MIGNIIRRTREIDPDEIFLDSSNLPSRDERQFEGRVVRPVSARAIAGVGAVFFLIVLVFAGRMYDLQVAHGASYTEISEHNRLDKNVVFAFRGVIYDRTGRELAWNEPGEDASNTPYALRAYDTRPGLSHTIGFIRYPKADARGSWWREEYAGVSGVERSMNTLLSGENGSTMVETDAHGAIQTNNLVIPAQAGKDAHLSIDADVQSALYKALETQMHAQHFEGGAGVIVDVQTGEILALTSVPEYNHLAFATGDSEAIKRTSEHSSSPQLNRAIGGVYAPGSIVKPIFAAAALQEKVIGPNDIIVSTGKITIPNPYDKEHPSIFRDWTVHGPIDMRTAIAVSSDEYFYTIGGGFGGRKGLGITKIDDYARRFGIGSTTGITLAGEQEGVIPTPAWKEVVFNGDPWRIGDTYHTAIGQYGFQITPIQAALFTAAIANGGKLLVPSLLASSTPQYREVGVSDEYLQIVREGMRLAVTSDRKDATAKSLYIGGIHIAAKTGTAQIGAKNQWMNSWAIGFWPAENPRYAFAAVLEKAPAGTNSGTAPGLAPFFRWLVEEHPEYSE